MNRRVALATIIALLFAVMGCRAGEEGLEDRSASPGGQAQGSSEPAEATQIESIEGLPEFEIINKREMGGAGISWNILVSEETSKTDALRLGEYLRKEYKPMGLVSISMYDSREALEMAGDTSRPGEFLRHYLVQVTVIPKAEVDTVIWMARDRDH